MNRAIAIDQIGFVVIGLARNAVVAGVRTFTDPTIIENRLHELLYRSDVPWLGGANEIIVADIQQFPNFLEPSAGLVSLFERCDSVGVGRALDLEAMFIGAGQKEGGISRQPMPPSKRVCCHRCVGVPDMGHIVHVIDGSGDVEGLGHAARLRRLTGSHEPHDHMPRITDSRAPQALG